MRSIQVNKKRLRAVSFHCADKELEQPGKRQSTANATPTIASTHHRLAENTRLSTATRFGIVDASSSDPIVTSMSHFIGKPIVRNEDSRFLKGNGRYVGDVSVDDMLHAAVFRSSWPHARIRGIEIAAAAALPGVVGVFSHADFSAYLRPIRSRIASMPGFENFLQLPLATDKVRYVGEPMAVVVATDPYVAEDAVSLIAAEVEALPPVMTWQAAIGSTLIHERAGTNISTVAVSRGDADAAFETAFYVRRENFSVQRHTAIPLETRGLLAVWDDDHQRMTVSGITKVPFFNRTTLAAMLELPEASVVMKVADAGGSFGVRGEFYPEDFLIPFIARKLNRAVKWIEDRREHFLSTNHAREASCELEIACDRDGVIVALRGEVTVDVGAYARGTGGTSPTRCAQFLPGPYRIPNYSCKVNAFVSNKTPSGTYRGPGRVEANFFRERLIDMAAADLAVDPAEIRRRNFVTAQEMPFNIGRLVNYEPPAVFDGGDFAAVFEQALREIGWRDKQSIQGCQIDGWYHGIGFSSFVESGAGGLKEYARICLMPHGGLDIYVGSTSSGQGHETVFAQVCADTLGLSLSDLRIICASTDELEDGFGTWHSRSAVMAGNAVRNTAQALLDRLRPLASEYFGRPNVAIEWRDGRFWRSDAEASATLAMLARFAADRGETIDVTGVFNYTGAKPFSYGTHAAHVAVDPRTGSVKLVDFIAIEDIGRVLNPLIVHGQALGAVVQGLGGAFLEHLQYDQDGQLLTASFADYLLPTASDFPVVRGDFMEIAPAPGNPLGAKGAGEGGIVAVAGAVANAVSAALSSFGAQVRSLPLSPPRVWQLIQDSQATSRSMSAPTG
jgi:aerobic carbon-monoxide dehydrogenase large subunit